jgi:hypothetical protein
MTVGVESGVAAGEESALAMPEERGRRREESGVAAGAESCTGEEGGGRGRDRESGRLRLADRATERVG